MPSTTPADEQVALSSILKDEILLIATLIVFVGIISTEAYYWRFGIGYQFLGLPPSHVLYRGVTILLDAPYLLIPYVFGVLWLWIDHHATLRGWRSFASLRFALSYLLILFLMLTSYPLARLAGRRQANRDLLAASSHLPRVLHLVRRNGQDYRPDTPATAYRVLTVGSEFLVVFVPVDSLDYTEPKIKRFAIGDIDVLETTP